jgi:hypothetical protein
MLHSVFCENRAFFPAFFMDCIRFFTHFARILV